MKLFNVWFRRITPQHFVTVVEAQDSAAAFKQAKDMGVLHPIVGERKGKGSIKDTQA